MKIAIVGMGIAGSYLAGRLGGSHEIVAYERFPEENFDAVCAWGTSREYIAKYAKNCGLNFEDYVTHNGSRMFVETAEGDFQIKLKGLCTFNKHDFVMDMAKGQEVHFGQYIHGLPNDDEFDLVVDATGMTRPLLPRIKQDVLIPSVQYLIKYSDPPMDDFYIKPAKGLSGYLWYFPLGNGMAHVGAGDFHRMQNEAIGEFLKKYPGKIIKKVGRPVRVTPPKLCEPLYVGKTVGVGESIGCVYPMLGEGIIPSLECAEIFCQNLGNLEGYRRAVLKHFSVYDAVFNMVLSKIQGTFTMRSQLKNLLKIYFHMKRNENRYGLECKMQHMLKVAKT
ncbi:MAG: dehydrogenase [Thaumarchaeota archaeon]|nr:dehydrogenase [Nitrososphaerota archaeon]